VYAVEGSSRALVRIAVIMRFKDQVDDRGSFTAIVDTAKNKVVFSTLGHPEWSWFVPSGLLWQIEPKVFFRIRGSGKTYFVGTSDGPWESMAFAIFDLQTGKGLLTACPPFVE